MLECKLTCTSPSSVTERNRMQWNATECNYLMRQLSWLFSSLTCILTRYYNAKTQLHYTMYPDALKYPAAFAGVILWQARSINPSDLSCQFHRRKAWKLAQSDYSWVNMVVKRWVCILQERMCKRDSWTRTVHVRASSSTRWQIFSAWWIWQLLSTRRLQGPGYGLVSGS